MMQMQNTTEKEIDYMIKLIIKIYTSGKKINNKLKLLYYSILGPRVIIITFSEALLSLSSLTSYI